jgi:hypothetical protein
MEAIQIIVVNNVQICYAKNPSHNNAPLKLSAYEKCEFNFGCQKYISNFKLVVISPMKHIAAVFTKPIETTRIFCTTLRVCKQL